jgi:hypothetical protein
MVSEKMTERLEVPREEEETSRISEETGTLDSVDDDDSTAQEDHEGDEGPSNNRYV